MNADKTRGAIAAGHPQTVEAARVIMEAGGNAFDASLAAMAMACIVEPVLASLGGGGFLLARSANSPNDPVLYDFFAQTPRVRKPKEEVEFYPVHADFGTTTQEFHIGAGSIATPGMVPGIVAIHQNLGRMPLRDIVQPAIASAREGVRVNAFQAYLFDVVKTIFNRHKPTLDCYGSFHGGLAKTGDVIKNPNLASTLDILSREGEAPFRQGDIAKAICDLSCDQGAHLTLDDLSNYRVERRKPLSFNHQGTRIFTNPGPSTGGALIGFALKMAERVKLNKYTYGSLEYYTALARIMEVTNVHRANASIQIDDPSLLDEALWLHYEEMIIGTPASHRGTTHISIIDDEGNSAAVTLSNGEGCSHMVPGAGFMLNNMLGEEDINPHGLQNWPENVRLSSMMAPTIIKHPDETISVLGSGGSNRIRTAMLQVILNLIDQSMAVEDAVRKPRIHFENNILNVEPLNDPLIIDHLKSKFSSVIPWEDPNMYFGGVHVVSKSETRIKSSHFQSSFQAKGDARRNGASSIF